MQRINNVIYFNNNRTTQVDGTVLDVMRHYGPGSLEAAREKALQQTAALLNAEPLELLFTPGAAEAINLVIKAAYRLYKHKGNHIITCVTEHLATLDCCRELAAQGAEITYLPVNREGLVDPEDLRRAIKPATVLVSIMAANNETGVVQPLEQLAEVCKSHNLFFFTDASLFAGKLCCDVKDPEVDALALSAHKMHGPAGIGLLYLHPRHTELMQAIRNSHTSPLTPAQLAGFGQAAELSQENHWEISAHISRLKNYFEHQLLDLEGLRINGSTRHRLYTTSNITFPDAGTLTALKDRFDFAGQAGQSSYVLKAMGLSDEEISRSFRFSFGKDNTLDEVKLLVSEIMKQGPHVS